jgi:hypothetical protein
LLLGYQVVVVEFINFIFCIPINYMNSESLNNSRKPQNIRAIFDWVMGIIYLGVGVVLTFAQWIGISFRFPPADVAQIFGTGCIIYGGFRIYRGFKTRHAD